MADITIELSTLGLSLAQPIPTHNYDYQLSLSTLVLDLTQQNPTVHYIYDLSLNSAMINIMRDGSVLSIDQGLKSWLSWNNYYVNDGVTDNIFGYTPDAVPNNNNGRGVTVTFKRNVVLTKWVIYIDDNTMNIATEYYNGSAWVNVATQANPKTSGVQIFDLDTDETINSTKWRWYITNFASASNTYAYEVEAYEPPAKVFPSAMALILTQKNAFYPNAMAVYPQPLNLTLTQKTPQSQHYWSSETKHATNWEKE